MKAVVVRAPGGLDRLELIEVPDPGEPRAGEVRVRIHASSLNYHDFGIASGAQPTQDGRILLTDGAGIIEAVGEGVTEFSVGDQVVSLFFPRWLDGRAEMASFGAVPGDKVDGFACESVVRSATCFTRAPQAYSPVESATLTTAGLTAWHALMGGDLRAGDTVLVLGTGGVSIFALQFAKALGARVIATSSSDAKLERLKALGADHTINYKTEPHWGAAVQAWTAGRGVDLVVEIGGPATLPQSIAAVRMQGHISLLGTLTGLSGEMPTALLMRKQVRLQGFAVGSRRQQLDMVRALDVLRVKPIIDRTFPLHQLADAFRFEMKGEHFGKIAIEVT